MSTQYVDPDFVPGQMPGFRVFHVHRYRVNLEGYRPDEIDCETAQDAIREFNRRNGLRASDAVAEQLY